MKKVGLFLMTSKGFHVLKKLVEKELHDMVAFVCIGKDPALTDDYAEELSDLCRQYGLRSYYRNQAGSGGAEADYRLAVSWRWMIDKPESLIVMHDSLLPRYRGFAPLVNALKNGEKKIGVTALMASEEYDRGPVISQKSCDVIYPVKIREAINDVSVLYGEIAIEIFQKIRNDEELTARAQDESRATYSLWLNDDDYRISWSHTSAQLKRFIDATGVPYDGAKCMLDGRLVKINDAEEIPDVMIENRSPGKVIFMEEGKPVVVCGKGLLKLTDAIDHETGESILPLKKFRTIFI